jgi:hypothetical protein
MSKIRWMILLLVCSVALATDDANQFEQNFINPPDSAKPHTWWHWMNGTVTKEGITADLEAMKRVGLGGFTAFQISRSAPGDVKYMSPQWHEMMKYTFNEANRLGLDAYVHNCAGWSSSGGPWITPEYAMQKVVWSEKKVDGQQKFNAKLEQPKTNKDYYRDITVLAFPTPAGEYDSNGFRISGWAAKAGFKDANKDANDFQAAKSDIIPMDKILVLTSQMDSAGNLKWDVPAGKWTIIRFGYTPTGVTNKPAPPEGQGLECDKLSREAAAFHWQNSVQKFIDDAGTLKGKTFKSVLIDSYEVKCQNWTHKFAMEFQKRTGYDIIIYLPVLTGRVVENQEISERFLWDFRKTIADMFTENYFGYFEMMCHKNGLLMSLEPYGDGNFNEFDAASKGDVLMGEFWATDANGFIKCDYTTKLAASGAHTYGKKYVGAESFTSGQMNAAFVQYPSKLKARGDYFYCQGLNRVIFHTYVHQPWMNVLPGMTMTRYGMQFNRNNTWFEKSTSWVEYLTRCQYLLQEGQFAADLCYLSSEEPVVKPTLRKKMSPQPPFGYDFDFCTVENLMQMKVKDGLICLPSEMTYKVLVLPQGNMRPAILKQIAKLVADGAIVYGNEPEKSPSLVNYPVCDEEIKKLADELWDSGKIVSGKSFEEFLLSKNIQPDFAFSDGINAPTQFSEKGIEYIHRKINAADVYFVSNQWYQSQTIQATFRVNHKLPEIWYPDTGKIKEAPAYSFANDGRMIVTLSFDPAGSMFVVFRKTVDAEKKAAEPAKFETMNIEGSWTLRFPKGWGTPEQVELEKLIDWTDSNNYDIQHFSGTAVYVKDFDFSASGKQVFLDLGAVNVIAEVKLNGKNLGILWKPPFKVEITDVIKTGSNHLEIEVTNTWANRIIGDEKYPDDRVWKKDGKKDWDNYIEIPQWLKEDKERPATERKTFATWSWYKVGDPLMPAGLIGPVTIMVKQ